MKQVDFGKKIKVWCFRDDKEIYIVQLNENNRIMFLQLGKKKIVFVFVYDEDCSIEGQFEFQYLKMEVWINMCYGVWQIVIQLYCRFS